MAWWCREILVTVRGIYFCWGGGGEGERGPDIFVVVTTAEVLTKLDGMYEAWEVRVAKLITNLLDQSLNRSGSHESFESQEAVLRCRWPSGLTRHKFGSGPLLSGSEEIFWAIGFSSPAHLKEVYVQVLSCRTWRAHAFYILGMSPYP